MGERWSPRNNVREFMQNGWKERTEQNARKSWGLRQCRIKDISSNRRVRSLGCYIICCRKLNSDKQSNFLILGLSQKFLPAYIKKLNTITANVNVLIAFIVSALSVFQSCRRVHLAVFAPWRKFSTYHIPHTSLSLQNCVPRNSSFSSGNK